VVSDVLPGIDDANGGYAALLMESSTSVGNYDPWPLTLDVVSVTAHVRGEFWALTWGLISACFPVRLSHYKCYHIHPVHFPFKRW